jgi:hypothetical protein
MVGSAIWRTLTAKGYTNLISFEQGAILETNKRSKVLWLLKNR